VRPGQHNRMPNWAIGLVMVVVLAIGSYLAFSKELPWGSKFEVQAVFSSAQNIRPDSPVRIAGVEVGKVTNIEHLESASEELQAQAEGDPESALDQASGEQAAVLTMELDESALPLHADATMKLRPRLFLEGNYFVDLQPGSPNAPEVDDGFTFPINQTSHSVALDQVLTTLQTDVRRNLQVFLDQFGNALIKHGGAEGFRELYRTSPPAFKYTSQVNDALLGEQPGDLRGVIRGVDAVVRALGRDQTALQNLVSNFATVSGSFAREDQALGRAIQELPAVLQAARPAFANLNASFPPLRAFAREALPGVRSTPETLDVATPFIRQVRKLVSKRELRGLVADLRPTVPRLARLANRTIPFLDEARALSSCANEVVLPWSMDTVEPIDPANQYPNSLDPQGRVFEEAFYGLSGIKSESRSGDANALYARVLGAGGLNTVAIPAVPGGLGEQVGTLPFPLQGVLPTLADSAKPDFHPEVGCETQEPPNLEAGVGAIPDEIDQGDVQSASSLADVANEPGELDILNQLSSLAGEAQQASDGDPDTVSADERAIGRELHRWLLSDRKKQGSGGGS
jgi:phospholipid/cholesterol/gamma-HCH transport system substrate-binding protein